METVALSSELNNPIQKQEAIDLAARKAIYTQFNEFLNREKGTLQGKNIEDLHRMRVSTRRMRSLLRSFKSLFGNKQVRVLADQLWRTAFLLGEIRDIDTFVVFLEECHEQIADSAKPSIHKLIEERLSIREKKRENLAKEFDREWYDCMKEDIVSFLNIPSPDTQQARLVADALPPLLEQDYQAIFSYRDNIQDVLPDNLHQLRIQIKRLRYLCDSFSSCYDQQLADLIKDFVELQNSLGAIQDHYRDIAYLQENRSILLQNEKSSDNDSSLEHLIDHLEKSLKKKRNQFFEQWERFTLKENEIRILYLIRNGIL